MSQLEQQQQDEQMDEDDEIDIVSINKEEEQLNNNSQECFATTLLTKTEDDAITQSTIKDAMKNLANSNLITNIETEFIEEERKEKTKQDSKDVSLVLAECNIGPAAKDCQLSSQKIDDNSGADSDEESLNHSAISSISSSRISSRRNSLDDSDGQRNFVDNVEVKHEIIDNLTPNVSDNDDDDDDNKEEDPYLRFFFESDYLALKDNKHYHLLLQTLVALEGQRIQAVKDLDTLCEEEAQALDDPIGFVEKLQNNEPLGLPQPQTIIKVPRIPWETYATSLGNVDLSLPMMQHNTRASMSSLGDKAPQVAQATLSVFGNDPLENNLSDGMVPETTRSNQPGKLPTFNQPWTVAEQTRLEKLLQIYPQEDIESKRWEKIAKALGNRTPKQVASRVQKYFIKLAKAGLPIPGRVPNIPRSGSRINKRSSHYQTIGFRNSTFFPSYQPRVYMNDNRDEDDESSIAFSDDTSFISDDESIPEEMKQTPDYLELLELKRIKRQKIKHADQQTSNSHAGFMCDGCGVDPIVGTRWHCQDCPQETSLDFCSACIDRGTPASRGHDSQHHFEPITKPESFFVDGDYVCTIGSSGTGYNYLDPNFLPAAS